MYLTRPTEIDGVRLFYRLKLKKYRNGRSLNLRDPVNMIIQVRLYRWSASPDFRNMVETRLLCEDLFLDFPWMTTRQIGAVVTNAVEYRAYRQRNPGRSNGPFSTFWWRFLHPMDLHYGVERMICSWLPDFVRKVSGGENKITDEQALLKELEKLKNMSPLEDVNLIFRPAVDTWFGMGLR